MVTRLKNVCKILLCRTGHLNAKSPYCNCLNIRHFCMVSQKGKWAFSPPFFPPHVHLFNKLFVQKCMDWKLYTNVYALFANHRKMPRIRSIDDWVHKIKRDIFCTYLQPHRSGVCWCRARSSAPP